MTTGRGVVEFGITSEVVDGLKRGEDEAFIQFLKPCTGIALWWSRRSKGAFTGGYSTEDLAIEICIYGITEYLPENPTTSPLDLLKAVDGEANRITHERQRRRKKAVSLDLVGHAIQSPHPTAFEVLLSKERIALVHKVFMNLLTRLKPRVYGRVMASIDDFRCQVRQFRTGEIQEARDHPRPLSARDNHEVRLRLLDATNALVMSGETPLTEINDLRKIHAFFSGKIHQGIRRDSDLVSVLIEFMADRGLVGGADEQSEDTGRIAREDAE